MTDAVIAADRGYNSSQVLIFLSQVLGASLLGTHKRDLWYPFVFGDGAIRARHRGMAVSERGCRAVYNARLKNTCAASCGRPIEAVLYRESCSGRVAAMILNNPSKFHSRGFTVVPHDRFQGEPNKLSWVVDHQTLFDTDSVCGKRKDCRVDSLKCAFRSSSSMRSPASFLLSFDENLSTFVSFSLILLMSRSIAKYHSHLLCAKRVRFSPRAFSFLETFKSSVLVNLNRNVHFPAPSAFPPNSERRRRL